MDRTFEEIREEVFHLDQASQRRLVDEIEGNLTESQAEVDEAWRQEIKRRLDMIDRGEATFLSEDDFFARGRAMIEEAKRKQK